jgi:hypothetical protein
MSPVDRRMTAFACTRLARLAGNDCEYQDYLAPDARVALLRDFEPGNLLLREKFGMNPFPALLDDDIKGGSPYPGISLTELKELYEHHARIRRSAGYRIERLAQLIRYFIVTRLDLIAWIVLPLGRLLLRRNRRRVIADVYGPERYRPLG